MKQKFLPAHGHCVIPGNAAAYSDATPVFSKCSDKLLLLPQASTAIVAHVFCFQSLGDQVIRLIRLVFTPP